MNRPATNRANFAYATELRRKGYLSAVHALPADCRDYIDSRLAEGLSPRIIANELMSRYGEQIEVLGLKPISHMSIRTYRDKYWKSTPQFRKIVTQGSEALKKATEEVKKEIDAYVEMVKWYKIQDAKAKMADNLEDKTKLPSKRGDESRMQAFNMAQAILEKEIELGLRLRVPFTAEATIETHSYLNDLSKEELIRMGKEAIDALERKGKYAKRPPTGEDLTKTALR